MNDLNQAERSLLHNQLIEEILNKPITPKDHAARLEIMALTAKVAELEKASAVIAEAKPAKKKKG